MGLSWWRSHKWLSKARRLPQPAAFGPARWTQVEPSGAAERGQQRASEREFSRIALATDWGKRAESWPPIGGKIRLSSGADERARTQTRSPAEEATHRADSCSSSAPERTSPPKFREFASVLCVLEYVQARAAKFAESGESETLVRQGANRNGNNNNAAVIGI